jgi:hypothetical protein
MAGGLCARSFAIRSRSHKKHWKESRNEEVFVTLRWRWVAIAVLLAAFGSARADAPPGAREPLVPSAVFAQVGFAENANAQGVGAAWRLPWRHDGESVVLTSHLELAVGRWRSEKPPANTTWFTQAGLTPVLRLQRRGGRWFAEAGIGLNVIAPLYRNGDRRFSTRFNFGDHLAVGLRFGPRGEHGVALRLQHFSNGGIEKPNPGEDFLQLRYLREF